MVNQLSSQQTFTRGIKSIKPATKWEDALITGNGEMGALVFGEPLSEQIILNHEKLYEPFHERVIQNNQLYPYLDEIKALMRNGRFHDASVLFSEKSGHPILFTDAYHPACALKLNLEERGQLNQYQRTVDFETGEVQVSWSDERGEITRKQFISRADKIHILQLNSSTNQSLNGELLLDGLIHQEAVKNHEVMVNDLFLSFKSEYAISKKGYVGGVLIVARNGELTESNQEGVIFKNADEIMILSKIVPLLNYESDVETALNEIEYELKKYSQMSYQDLLTPHILLHKDMFDRVTFEICNAEELAQPTESLLAKKQDSFSNALLQKMFDMGRYVFICSSGDYPPNLVGLWTGDWRPAWSGDFTTDANLNLAVSGGGIGNMPEALEGYFKLIEKLVPDWKTNAKTLYGCRGILAGTCTDGNHNIHTHFNEDWPLAFWTAGAEWLVHPFFEWYQISGDKEFFINRTLPLMKEIALFYQDFLTEKDENGKFEFIPSYSPENTPILSKENLNKGWQTSQASINATMDIAAAKELFTNLILTCNELNIERDQIKIWQNMLDQMPEYMINEDGALKEWIHRDLHDQYNHRHISHLYPVWPGHELTPESNPDLFKASEIALQLRERENYSAHGIMHCGIVAARQKNAHLVMENLKLLLEDGDYIYSSLVTSHNPGQEIYNVDAICSLPTLVMEMLVYTYPGFVELLPALPNEIKKGVITGVRGRGQLTIEKLEWDLEARHVNLELYSRKNQEIKLKLTGMSEIKTSNSELPISINTDTVLLNLIENKSIEIVMHLE